ncbi:MAG: hypothetical protein IH946_08140, partial [Bacteroidetes bacterium]|nr:hypothetical protein [Bacteroidota bacterium]
NGGIGPGFIYRQDWHQFDDYNTDPVFGDRVYKGYQYRFIPAAITLEYLFDITDQVQFQYTLLPGIVVFSSTFGLRFKL